MANRYPPKKTGRTPILNHDEIRAMIQEGKQPKEIAEAVGTKRGYISKLKWKWGVNRQVEQCL